MTHASDDRIVQVLKYRGREIWACGGYRAEAYRVTSREWAWQVWHVWGMVIHGRGTRKDFRDASRACLECLRRVAGAIGPDLNI